MNETSNIVKLNANVLNIHPRNKEFFDDIEGENYEQFKKSIEEDGVITPLIVSPDMTIISGHQRLKACKDLGIEQVPVIIREDLVTEEEKLKKLLATNFGRTKNDTAKQRKVVVEYVELCGNKNGGDRKSERTMCGLKSQKEIAQELGISERTLQELLEIERKLTPEMKELLDEGKITKSVAGRVLTKLTKEEQDELLADLGEDKLKEMTQKELKLYVDKIKELTKENENLKGQVKEPKIITQVVEKTIDNTDYTLATKLKEYKDKLEKQNKIISNNEKMIKDQDGLIKSLEELNASQDKAIKEKYARYDKLDELERQIKNATRRKDDIDRAIESGTELSSLIVEIENFLKTKLCPINYSRAIFEQKNSPVVIENVTEIVSVVEQWCYDMKKMIKTTVNSDEYDGEIIDVEINK